MYLCTQIKSETDSTCQMDGIPFKPSKQIRVLGRTFVSSSLLRRALFDFHVGVLLHRLETQRVDFAVLRDKDFKPC